MVARIEPPFPGSDYNTTFACIVFQTLVDIRTVQKIQFQLTDVSDIVIKLQIGNLNHLMIRLQVGNLHDVITHYLAVTSCILISCN